MVLILVLLTIAFFIVVELLRTSRKRAALGVKRPEVHVPAGMHVIERFIHPGHSWVLVDDPKRVTVGADDFAQRFVGSVDAVELPEAGTLVHQGSALFTLRHGRRALTQVSPITGIVTHTNELLAKDPTLVNTSPYDKGWIAKIAPLNLATELRNLLRGANAERWKEAVRLQFAQWFTPKFGTVMQDGGTFIDDLGSLLNDDEWNRLAHEFFPVCTFNRRIHNNHTTDSSKDRQP